MKLIVIVSFVFKICSALDINITELYDQINVNDTDFLVLGENIKNVVLNPNGTSEEQLMSDVDEYHKALGKLHHDMKLEYQYTFDIYDKIKNTGGPLHCQEHLNGSELITYFKLLSPYVLKLYRTIEATKIIWDDLEDLAKELREKYRKATEITTPDGLGISQIEWQRREAKMDLRAEMKRREQELKERRQSRREERARVRQELEFAKQQNRLRKLQIRRAKEKERLQRKVRGGRNKV